MGVTTDQQSFDDIAMLLMQYDGVRSARGFGPDHESKVRIHFRCNDFSSLGAIASCGVAANVAITVGNPRSRLCYESDKATDMPFDVEIADGSDFGQLPTYP